MKHALRRFHIFSLCVTCNRYYQYVVLLLSVLETSSSNVRCAVAVV